MSNEASVTGTVKSGGTIGGTVKSNGTINGKVAVGGSMLIDAVLYTEQELTQEEKAQARRNIDALSEEYVNALYAKMKSNTVLAFYCVEDVTVVTNGVSKTYPANSNVEISFAEGDVFEVIPTSDKSILTLTAFPNTLGTFYS